MINLASDALSKCVFGKESKGGEGVSLSTRPSVNLTDVTLADKETNLILLVKLTKSIG